MGREDDVKCDSPTGAHHWVQLDQTEELRKSGYFQCKYCMEVRRFAIYWDQVSGKRDPNKKYPLVKQDEVERMLDQLSNRRLG